MESDEIERDGIDRQGTLFDMTAPVPPWRSDERALAEMTEMVETLEAAKAHPWSARLPG